MRRHFGAGGSHSVPQENCAPAAAGTAIRYVERDGGADGGLRQVELHDDHVVIRRRRAGIPMKFTLRHAAFRGVAVRLADPEGDGEGIEIVLVHPDAALTVVLQVEPDADDVVAHWRRWTAHLGLPMLRTEPDGSYAEAQEMLGRLVIAAPLARRRLRGALKCRRPLVFKRRPVSASATASAVHRGECEIIARD
ncbi:DUF6101 family protein [Ancylobacter terrae]|uniref:DUF6101 family protein n=1 Tax=Ancylobacter sp. sgz301288 TaxID=3342077 RepID=UPI00385CB158